MSTLLAVMACLALQLSASSGMVLGATIPLEKSEEPVFDYVGGGNAGVESSATARQTCRPEAYYMIWRNHMLRLLGNILLSCILISGCIDRAVAEEAFRTGAVYGDKDKDGLWSTISVTRGEGGTQNLAENTNELMPFTCKTVLNYKDNVTVPPGYNPEKDFLSRTFVSCAWTTNECGLPACTEENVRLTAGRYYQPSRSQLCAVWQTGMGNGVTAPRCFRYITGLDKQTARSGAIVTPVGEKKK